MFYKRAFQNRSSQMISKMLEKRNKKLDKLKINNSKMMKMKVK